MHYKFFYVLGNFDPGLGFIRHISRSVLTNGDPDLFAGFYHDPISLHRCLSIVVGIYNEILYKVRYVGVVPATFQRLHLLARPSSKSVGAVIRPSPQAGTLPTFRRFYYHRYHFVRLGGKRNNRQTRQGQ